MEKFKCNPLSCFALFFTINLFLWGWIKADLVEIRSMMFENMKKSDHMAGREYQNTFSIAKKAFAKDL